MKKRVTIYVDAIEWENIKFSAMCIGKSASQYLTDLALSDRENIKSKKLDWLKGVTGGEPLVYEGGKTDLVANYTKEKPGKVIKTVEDIPSTFRSYSKADQLGKKK